MPNPIETLRIVAEGMGWLNQFLPADFWSQVAENIKPQGAASPADAPEGPQAERRLRKAPPVDLFLTPTEVVLHIAAPGLAGPEQVQLGLTGPQALTIELFFPPVTLTGVLLQQERFAGYCARTLPLPAAVGAGGATARYADGLIELHLPRLEVGTIGDGVALIRVPAGD